MSADNLHENMVHWLQEKGHSQEEIDQILERIRQYETQTQHDSVMDSIGADSFDFSDLIQQVLREPEA